ncbi:MAG: carboxymuconolactone decarboxylase family protein [Actinomycetota bacterium]
MTDPNPTTGSWLVGPDASIDRALALRPELAELWHRLDDELWTDPTMDPIVLELCRLRVAQLHRASGSGAHRTRAAVDAGLTEELVDALPSWSTDDRFDATTRAALTVAELFVMDVHAVTDEQMAAVTAALGPSALTTFTTALAVWDGICRFERVLVES